MRVAATLSLIAVAFAGTAVALAQDPAAPSGNYGGGAVVAPPKALSEGGNMLIGLRVQGATVKFNAGLGAGCESSSFSATATLDGSGAFSASGTRRESLSGGRRVRTSYDVQGTISGATASGTARVRSRVTARGRATRTCTSGTVRWGARRSTGDLGGPGAVAKAHLYGTTSQRREGPRRAIVMRISADATKLTRALYDIDLRCEGRTVRGLYDSPRRNLPIKADGTVADVERFTYRDRTTILRYIETFEATLGQAGARGSFSTVSILTSRRTGRTLGTCRTGTVTWTAST